jgi:hypothetical protein
MPTKSERRRAEILELLEAIMQLGRDEVPKESLRRLWRKHVELGPDLTKVMMGSPTGLRFVTPGGEPVFEAEYTLYDARKPGADRPAVQPTNAEMAAVFFDAARKLIRMGSSRHVAVEVRDGKLEAVHIDQAGEDILELANLLMQATGPPPPTCRSCGRRLDPSRRAHAYCSQRCQKRGYRAALRSGRGQSPIGTDS